MRPTPQLSTPLLPRSRLKYRGWLPGTSTTSYSVTISPICKNDLVFLPRRVSRSLGGFGPLVLCVRVASTLSLLCLSTLEVKEIAAGSFFKSPFSALLSEGRLVEYTVLDVEPLSPRGGGERSTRAMIEVALSADFGVNVSPCSRSLMRLPNCRSCGLIRALLVLPGRDAHGALAPRRHLAARGPGAWLRSQRLGAQPG